MWSTPAGARFVCEVSDNKDRGPHAKAQSRKGKADMSIYLLGSVRVRSERPMGRRWRRDGLETGPRARVGGSGVRPGDRHATAGADIVEPFRNVRILRHSNSTRSAFRAARSSRSKSEINRPDSPAPK